MMLVTAYSCAAQIVTNSLVKMLGTLQRQGYEVFDHDACRVTDPF